MQRKPVGGDGSRVPKLSDCPLNLACQLEMGTSSVLDAVGVALHLPPWANAADDDMRTLSWGYPHHKVQIKCMHQLYIVDRNSHLLTSSAAKRAYCGG